MSFEWRERLDQCAYRPPQLIASRELLTALRVWFEQAEGSQAAQQLVRRGDPAFELLAELSGGPTFFVVLAGECAEHSAFAVSAE